ncbi:aminotransferase class V-fold PLP-dependent enzyme [Phycicoccus flavus]|uniref:aminotransferase class V-fold PLP-dependent enzyme n=1 Tax=Phycicoccus flavus TaxID=2502783 RepID=UPI000FEC16D0|nr:aminotransferase class V-fold PLP-dependent enzyme [Phycicoccus flavus]NHA69335.1 aminotransferase class V-fold PLP-dependent enzyme [Phycicoccus flavus]
MSLQPLASRTHRRTPRHHDDTPVEGILTDEQLRTARVRPVGGGLPAVVAPGLVPTVDGRLVDYAPLDHAASTPAFERVARAVDAVTATYSSVHRGTGWLSRVTSAHYEAAREEVGRFVGARPDDVVVLTRNTTDAVTLLARCLPAGTPVVVLESEHHASLLPWAAADVHRVPVPRHLYDALASVEAALAGLDPRRTGGPQPLLVVSGASNVTGELWPLTRLVGLARRHGARVLIDAAQLLAHRSLDLESLGADWVAFSGHKLHAPYGTGALVGRRDVLDAAEPYLPGGGASAAVTHDGTRWATGAARHEGGTPNVVGAVALAAACATLREHRREVEEHEAALTARLVDGLRGIPGVRTYSLLGEDLERAPVVTFTIDGLDSGLVAAALSAEHGIGVRAGKFCAHLLVDALLRDEAAATGRTEAPTTAVRASAGIATTLAHVDRLVTAVAALAGSGPAVRYVHDDARGWLAEEDPRDPVVPLPW